MGGCVDGCICACDYVCVCVCASEDPIGYQSPTPYLC